MSSTSHQFHGYILSLPFLEVKYSLIQEAETSEGEVTKWSDQEGEVAKDGIGNRTKLRNYHSDTLVSPVQHIRAEDSAQRTTWANAD